MKEKNQRFETVLGICFMLLASVFLIPMAGYAGTDRNMAAMKNGSGVNRTHHVFKDDMEKQSYALGIVFGNQLRKQKVEMDVDFYAQGMKDALSGGSTLLSEREALMAIKDLRSDLRAKRTAVTKEVYAPAPLKEIRVSFKLDPRLTRAQYMGDRWVSKPTFTSTIKTGSEASVDIRIQGIDEKGRPVQITPEWIPADPDMVTIESSQGNRGKITVLRPGVTSLDVTAQGITKRLTIKATARHEIQGMQVDIVQ